MGCAVVSSVNNSLVSYLTTQTSGSSATKNDLATALAAKVASTSVPDKTTNTISQAALQRAAGTTRATSAAQALENSQKALGTGLRAAMEKAGVKLTAPIEFAVKSDGSVSVKGTDADKAAVQAFLKADTSQPSFASRIATQAKDAMKLSSSIQQSAAISQAAKLSKSTDGVMSLYNSLMQRQAATNVVFSVSATSSSLTYPGSLTANA